MLFRVDIDGIHSELGSEWGFSLRVNQIVLAIAATTISARIVNRILNYAFENKDIVQYRENLIQLPEEKPLKMRGKIKKIIKRIKGGIRKNESQL